MPATNARRYQEKAYFYFETLAFDLNSNVYVLLP